jgi:hypothetical protein
MKHVLASYGALLGLAVTQTGESVVSFDRRNGR